MGKYAGMSAHFSASLSSKKQKKTLLVAIVLIKEFHVVFSRSLNARGKGEKIK
jgi:hypothetical protein